MIADEHCSKYDKYYYYSTEDLNKGKMDLLFFIVVKTLLASPLTSDK